MSLKTRKSVFQLTPLLDLLLIIIFAQYMDVRQAGARQNEWFEVEAEKLKSEMTSMADTATSMRRQAETELALAQSQIEALKDAQNVNQELVNQLQLQTELLSEFINQALELSPQMVEELLSKTELAQDEKFRKTVEELRELTRSSALQHAVTYHELLKRCDIWEVYLANAAVSGSSKVIFRASEDTKEWTVRDLTAFRQTFKSYIHSRPQPKSQVIVLSGFVDENLTFGQREDFRLLLIDAFRELTMESNGQTRHYVSNLGYLGDSKSTFPE